MEFSQTIDIIGVNPYVIPPKAVLSKIFQEAGKDKGTIPVKGKINGKDFIQTLVRYQGAWRLYINGIMRKAAGVDVGDTVHVEVEYDSMPRLEPINPLLQMEFEKNKKAQQTFNAFSPSRQKEINRYLNSLKNKETLIKNVDRIVRHLSGDPTVEYFVLLRNKK